MIRVAVTFAVLAGIGGALQVSSQAKTRDARVARSAARLNSSETGIRFSSNVITVDRATVRKNLIGVSADGSTFKFKHGTGALAKLKSGKVMLLQGSDALVVTSITHSHGQLLVHTKPATLTQVIRSGKIRFSGSPDFRKAFLASTIAAPSKHGAADFSRPTYPYVGRSPGPLTASASAGPSFSVQGSSGNFGYSLTFTPSSATRLDVSGVICFQIGSICSNGPSNGLSAELNLSGFVDAGSEVGRDLVEI